MSLELKDFRGKLTVETDCVLEAMTRSTGKERQEIVREVLHNWALESLDMHNVLHSVLKREGIIRE